jgi:hypothetical protein
MATREDAELVVQLLRWGTEMGFDDALRKLFSPDFDPETAPMDNPDVAKVLSFGETVGTLVKHELLDAELVWDLLWIEGIWSKVRRHAVAAREEENEPRLYENFEALVTKSAQLTPG